MPEELRSRDAYLQRLKSGKLWKENEKAAGERKALVDQAQWRETLRKKVEDRCVKLESKVAEHLDC